MIPENRFSSQSLSGVLLNPWSKDHKISYQWGPIQLQDPSQGILVKLWKLEAIDNTAYLSSEDNPAFPVFTHTSEIFNISLSFDQNGRHQVTFEDVQDNSYFYWWDPLENDYVFFLIPDGGHSPRTTLDDARTFNQTDSDVILGYIRDKAVRYRRQRDRYTIEYTPTEGELGPPAPADLLYHISMQDNLRLNFVVGDIPYIWGVSNIVRKQITQQKAPAEILTLPFEFRQMMMFGESIIETETVITVQSGEDSDPTSMLGDATYSQTVVSQIISGGLPGVVYKLAISILTDQGCVYVMEGLVYVNASEALIPDGG